MKATLSVTLNQFPGTLWDLMMILKKFGKLGKNNFFQIADKHAPIKKRRVGKISAPWLTAEIKNLMRERDHLKRKAVITKDESDWVNFKTKKNLVKYKIRNSKQQYYNSYISNNVDRTKETWKGINSILSKAKGSIKIPKIVVNGTEIYDPESISNAFNEYFTEIGSNLQLKSLQIPVQLLITLPAITLFSNCMKYRQTKFLD
jgi:hypothetical protein